MIVFPFISTTPIKTRVPTLSDLKFATNLFDLVATFSFALSALMIWCIILYVGAHEVNLHYQNKSKH